MTNLQNAETNTFVFTDSCGFGPLLSAQLNGNFVDVDWQTPDGPIPNSSQITAPSVGWYVWTLQQNCIYTDSVFIADPDRRLRPTLRHRLSRPGRLRAGCR